MRRCCCGEDACTNPTGTHYINVDVLVAANVPTSPFGGSQSFYFLEDWDLEYNGTTLVTANSSVRFRAECHSDLRYPDNSVYSQYNRIIDVTLVPSGGDFSCGNAAAGACEDCGSSGYFRLDPRVRLPSKVNGVQLGSVTVNAYTNTHAGAASTYPFESVVVGWSTQVSPSLYAFASWGRDDLGNIVQPTYSTGDPQADIPPDGYPARVYQVGSSYQICTPINHNKISGYRNVPFSAGWYACEDPGPLCESNKGVLEKQGYVFTSYSRTATITT